MASGPFTSWDIDEETVETVADLNFLGSKITADGDYSHEIKTLTLSIVSPSISHELMGQDAMIFVF